MTAAERAWALTVMADLADDLAERDRQQEAAVLLAAADERRRISGVTASPEEERAAQRVEARRRLAGAPEPTGAPPTLQDILGPELWLEPVRPASGRPG